MIKSNITKIIETNASEMPSKSEKSKTKLGIHLSLKHPDIIIISPKKASIGISEVNHLSFWAYTKPYSNDYKYVIIESADLLTVQAQNSLLKIIEEPPIFTQFFLFVENHFNLLPTIISRSELINHKKELKNNNDIKSFLNLNLIEKFKVTDSLTKKPVILISNFIDDLIIYLRSLDMNTEIISKLLDSKLALKRNVSKKLLLDNIVLMLHI